MSLTDELSALARLRAEGLLTEEEYSSAKSRLLSSPASPIPAPTWSSTPGGEYSAPAVARGSGGGKVFLGVCVGVVIASYFMPWATPPGVSLTGFDIVSQLLAAIPDAARLSDDLAAKSFLMACLIMAPGLASIVTGFVLFTNATANTRRGMQFILGAPVLAWLAAFLYAMSLAGASTSSHAFAGSGDVSQLFRVVGIGFWLCISHMIASIIAAHVWIHAAPESERAMSAIADTPVAPFRPSPPSTSTVALPTRIVDAVNDPATAEPRAIVAMPGASIASSPSSLTAAAQPIGIVAVPPPQLVDAEVRDALARAASSGSREGPAGSALLPTGPSTATEVMIDASASKSRV